LAAIVSNGFVAELRTHGHEIAAPDVRVDRVDPITTAILGLGGMVTSCMQVSVGNLSRTRPTGGQGGTMATPTNPEETAQCEHISRMLARISDKWSMLVVRVLGRGPRRFNALRREIGEISQKVLASTLRDLEENGFVSRKVTPVTPPQVEYALTDLGRDLLAPVQALAEWVVANAERMDAARHAYAERRGRNDGDRGGTRSEHNIADRPNDGLTPHGGP
jgi:DNA-binding HxlR family transcriptional regulator